MRKRAAVMVFMLLAAFTFVPAVFAPVSIFEYAYYSDFYQTLNGWRIVDNCEPPYYDQFGTLDGAYMWIDARFCDTAGGWTKCFEKVNGNWSQIECPDCCGISAPNAPHSKPQLPRRRWANKK
jgi:hypothetical protein